MKKYSAKYYLYLMERGDRKYNNKPLSEINKKITMLEENQKISLSTKRKLKENMLIKGFNWLAGIASTALGATGMASNLFKRFADWVHQKAIDSGVPEESIVATTLERLSNISGDTIDGNAILLPISTYLSSKGSYGAALAAFILTYFNFGMDDDKKQELLRSIRGLNPLDAIRTILSSMDGEELDSFTAEHTGEPAPVRENKKVTRYIKENYGKTPKKLYEGLKVKYGQRIAKDKMGKIMRNAKIRSS